MRRADLAAALLASAWAGTGSAAEPGPLPRPQVEIGALCGDRDIVGEALAPIEDAGDCGIASPVRVTAVAGVALSPAPTIACDAARALASWVRDGATPAFAAIRLDLQGLSVADSYSCRNRNQAADGKLSEHARGRAIDIAAFTMTDGTRVTVADGWTQAAYGGALRRLYAAGCGPFTTTLGPRADTFHRTHMHFDVEPRTHGPYCH